MFFRCTDRSECASEVRPGALNDLCRCEVSAMSAIVTTRILYLPVGVNPSGHHRPWVWPLPRLEGMRPRILSTAERSLVDGVEIGYQDRSSTHGFVPVFTAQDGVIAYAGADGNGQMACLDHAGGWSTQYSDLERLLVRPTDRLRRRRKERVQAGDVIGHAPRSSLRIRFSLTRLADDECMVADPGAWMSTWSMLPWFDVPLPSQPGVRPSDGAFHAVPGRSSPVR